MPVKVITTELGHSIPPEVPHNITFHIPGWDTAKALRRGDPDLLAKLSSIYPRFSPWCEVRQLSTLIHKALSLPETHGVLLFTHPDVFPLARRYAASHHRKPEHRIPPEDLLFHVVDLPLTTTTTTTFTTLPSSSSSTGPADTTGTGTAATTTTTTTIRLFVVAYPLARAPGAVGVWQNHGIGISSRLAAALLPAAERGEVARVVDGGGGAEGEDDDDEGEGEGEGEREGRGLPLGEAHVQLRRRIAGLARGRVDVAEDDVFLYPTGMAAIYRLHRALEEVRGGRRGRGRDAGGGGGGGGAGTVVVLGSVFHNSFHLFRESDGGMKHFGRCDAASGVMDALEEYLEGERRAGRPVAYVFAEFPSNPILVSVDLQRLRELADKYGVPVVIDETIGSFCNIDVLHLADVIVTSTTKSVSGYANVMGGSVVVSRSSTHYTAIKTTLAARFRNEYFEQDAAQLLRNSGDYHARSAVLNRNALALARFLHEYSQGGGSPVRGVLYPPFTDTHGHYAAVMRPATGDHFAPGYGCLLAVEFASLAAARAFYDNLAVYQGPHLGAHQTLAFPFNDAIWGVEPEAAAYVASFGARPEQVRISVGLESEEELIDTFRAALRFAEERFAEEKEEEEKKRSSAGGEGS